MESRKREVKNVDDKQQTTSSRQQEIPNPAARVSIGEVEWKNFLARLHNEKPQLSSIVEHGIFSGGGNGLVRLEYSAGSVYGEMLKESHRRAQLEDLIEKHFGEKFSIEFSFANEGVSSYELKKTKLNERAERAKKIKEETLSDEIVREAVSILGADVREIKVKE